MSATGRPAEAGATLIEALVALAIAGMITAIAFPNLARGLDRMALRGASRMLAADLGLARAQAIRSGQAVALTSRADGKAYGWRGSRERTLPGGVQLAAPAGVVFFPDGAATPARMRLSGAAGDLSLTVDPTSGAASAGA